MFDEALQAYSINSTVFKAGRNADAASPLSGGWARHVVAPGPGNGNTATATQQP